MEFNKKLRTLRTNRNMSQSQLATALGISKSSISMYELSERQPDFETLEAIADFFNVDMNCLLGDESNSTHFLASEAAEIAQEISHTAFSKNLRYLRKKNHMSQEDLANKLGYKSFTTIQKWESGVSEPSVSMVKKIAELFSVTIDQITNDGLSSTKSHYGLNPEAAEIAQEVQSRPELKILFDATRNVSADDLKFIVDMIDRMQGKK